MTLLSVVVTSYNVQAYIREAIESLTNQTLTDMEIIVVDDGSTDSTPAIIRELAERDSRITAVLQRSNTPGGVAAVANAGMDRASGEYIGFLDGDDFASPTMFEKLTAAAAECSADVSMCQFDLVDDATGSRSPSVDQGLWDRVDTMCLSSPNHDDRDLLLTFTAVPWRKIYRKEFLDGYSIRFPEGPYFYEDNPFHWFTVLQASSIAFVREVLVHHRMGRAGQTRSAMDRRALGVFSHQRTIDDWLREQGLDEEFTGALIRWVVSQLGWVSAAVPAKLRPELFAVASQALEPYPIEQVEIALRARGVGERSRALARSVKQNNLATFSLIIDRWDKRRDPLISAAYYARYARHGNTIAGATDAVRRRLGMESATPTGPRDQLGPRERDILVAIALLDARLERIELQLSARPRNPDSQ